MAHMAAIDSGHSAGTVLSIEVHCGKIEVQTLFNVFTGYYGQWGASYSEIELSSWI